jgi:hypothetical protein
MEGRILLRPVSIVFMHHQTRQSGPLHGGTHSIASWLNTGGHRLVHESFLL